MTNSDTDSRVVEEELPSEATRLTRTESIGPPAPHEPSLVQIYGPNLGQRYVLDKPVTTIGRDRANDIFLESDNVSRSHAQLISSTGSTRFVDLHSTNGSRVNDMDCMERELQHGDLIKIGSVMLKFLSGGNAEALYHEEIYRLTIHDGLTGVANRRHLDDFLEREIARAIRYNRPLYVALLDIDHFKKVNDTHGHQAGDHILRSLAKTIQTTIRREELLARYGGEEFAVVMPERSNERAMRFAEKIRKLAESTTFTYDDKTIPITLSVGVACLGGQFKSLVQLLRAADEALYRAKHEGRNRVIGVGLDK